MTINWPFLLDVALVHHATKFNRKIGKSELGSDLIFNASPKAYRGRFSGLDTIHTPHSLGLERKWLLAHLRDQVPLGCSRLGSLLGPGKAIENLWPTVRS